MTTVPANGSAAAPGNRPAIVAHGVAKRYRRVAASYRLRTLKSALLQGSLTAGLRDEEAIVALEDVSFEVARGEAFGVVGGNGSGKSTLLKLVAGLLKPSAGTLVVDGRVAALIELGAGFHPEISGRENVFINGALLGLARREIERRYERIVEFAGLGDFMEEPVKNYSSGMYVRLGFAVAVHTDPDLLLVDEVLSVGDEAFAHRCLRRIEEHLLGGGTLLVVSHSLDLVASLCNRVLWLDQGRPRLLGEPRRVIDAYREAVAHEEGRALALEVREAPAAEEEVVRWGDRSATIEQARMIVAAPGERGAERYHCHSGDSVTFELEIAAPQPLEDFVFGVAIATPRGTEVWGTNSHLAGYTPQLLAGCARVAIHCPALRLAPGEYTVDLAVHAQSGAPYDYRRRLLRFAVSAPWRGVGVYAPEHHWRVSDHVRWQAPPTPTEWDPGGGE